MSHTVYHKPCRAEYRTKHHVTQPHRICLNPLLSDLLPVMAPIREMLFPNALAHCITESNPLRVKRVGDGNSHRGLPGPDRPAHEHYPIADIHRPILGALRRRHKSRGRGVMEP